MQSLEEIIYITEIAYWRITPWLSDDSAGNFITNFLQIPPLCPHFIQIRF